MTLSVQTLLDRKREVLSLTVLAGETGLEREIGAPEVSSPGLALAGFPIRCTETSPLTWKFASRGWPAVASSRLPP